MSVGNVEYLLDSNFILGLLKANKGANAFSKRPDIDLKQCAYSVITRIELLGFAKIDVEEQSLILWALGQMKRLSLNPEIEDSSIVIRKRYHKIKLPDAVILGTALYYQLQFLTFDKDLQKIFQKQKH